MQKTSAVPQPITRIDSKVERAENRSEGRSSGDPRSISAEFFLSVLRRSGLWTIPLGCVFGAIAAIVIWQITPLEYQAAAWIQIDSHSPYILKPTEQDSQKFVETQIELIKSPIVLEPALMKLSPSLFSELDTDATPMSFVEEKLKINRVGQSDLFQVKIVSQKPEIAAQVVNQVVSEYMSKQDITRAEKTRRLLELLEYEKQSHGEELEKLQQKVHTLGAQTYGNDAVLSPTETTIDTTTQRLRDRLTSVEVERTVTEAELRSFESLLTENDTAVYQSAIEQGILNDPNVADMRQMITNKAAQMQRLLTVVAKGKQDPRYLRLQKQHDELNAELEAMKERVRPEVIEHYSMLASKENEDQLAGMKVRLKALKASEAMLVDRLKDENSEKLADGELSMDYEFARAELERKRDVYEKISQRAIHLRTETQAPWRVSLLREATPDHAPVEPMPAKKMLLAFLLGLGLPLGAVSLREFFAQRIDNSKDLGKALPTSLVAEVANVPPPRSFASTSHASQIYIESVDNLRNAIQLSAEGDETQVISISSAVSGEGKTRLAVQLATSLATSTGEPVILVDGDLRAPDIAETLEIENKHGLVNVLAGEGGYEEFVDRSLGELITILPAGQLATNPHRLIRNETIRPLLAELRADYRFVIIDTPPVLCASESLVLARNADATLVCTMRDHSQRHQVELAYHRLIQANANPIGAVLNGVPTRQYVRQYGRYRSTSDSNLLVSQSS